MEKTVSETPVRNASKNKLSPVLVKVAFVGVAVICLSSLVTGPVALVGGFLFLNVIGHPFQHLNHKAVSWLLKIAVVGLGFGMNIHAALKAGSDGLALTAGSILLVLTVGFLIGKLLNMQRTTTHLISSGTAICGGSAIAAIAPIIDASEKEISVSLGVVFLLNSIALLLFPVIGHLLNLTDYQFGLWSAIAIHDTSSVVGAAHAFGGEALSVATTVKLARALWIIPLSVGSILLFKGDRRKIKIPWFIFLFFAAIVLNSYVAIPAGVTASIVTVSKSLLVLTLFLIGAGLSVEKIKSVGWQPMIVGVSLWAMVSVISLLVIRMV